MLCLVQPCHAEWYGGAWQTPGTENIYSYLTLLTRSAYKPTDMQTQSAHERVLGLVLIFVLTWCWQCTQVRSTGAELSCVGTTSCVATRGGDLCEGPISVNMGWHLKRKINLLFLTITPCWRWVCAYGVKPFSCRI